ncbi:hypothetical protein [Dolosicoccus paucivorans]|uniref:Uncharacterized protein n=1 Tax=Dolosicoccus paucivorans TaxID=84521 RepID=A0A1G8KLG4_9LACT|nr:hypothetical protein [Dolosicoccus paucivorans]PMB83665.1 hypothetical protein CJ206_07915 [Dolosicoccus paucivorans]PMC58178.1 hypothetical protein CJ205_05675 [Dolosicoccus paucivorans]SDI44239.1 hypothetical protein SAMN04487994_101214 [Dolosicoccus paucivorans]
MISEIITGAVLLYLVAALFKWLSTDLQQRAASQQKELEEEKSFAKNEKIPYQPPVQKDVSPQPTTVSKPVAPPQTTYKKKPTLQTNRKALRNALIMSEILKKPKGL